MGNDGVPSGPMATRRQESDVDTDRLIQKERLRFGPRRRQLFSAREA